MGRVEKSLRIPVIKKDDKKRLVSVLAMKPSDEIPAGEIEKAAHRFIADRVKGKLLEVNGLIVTESMVAPQDMEIGSRKVKKGSWVLSLKAKNEQTWRDLKEAKNLEMAVEGTEVNDGEG